MESGIVSLQVFPSTMKLMRNSHRLIDAVSPDDIYVVHGRSSSPLSKDWREKVQNPKIPALGHPRVWLIGDAIHAMLPARGMGANQALHDCADALEALVALADAKKKNEALLDAEVMKYAHQYESKMMPRAFSWVKKSGGTNEKVSRIVFGMSFHHCIKITPCAGSEL